MTAYSPESSPAEDEQKHLAYTRWMMQQDLTKPQDLPVVFKAGWNAHAQSVDEGWIPCSERLPEIGERVLLYLPEDFFYVGHRTGPIDWNIYGPHSVTHWRNLPAPPTTTTLTRPRNEGLELEQETGQVVEASSRVETGADMAPKEKERGDQK